MTLPYIISSLSGGKDSVKQTIDLVARYGPERVIAHLQVLPEDWPETLPYVQEVCATLGVRLIAQQVLYEPVGDGTAVRRLEIRDVRCPADIVQPGTDGVITGVSDLALRRGWPPAPACRYCTSYYKRDLLSAWIVQNRHWLGDTIVVALGERAAESPRRARKAELWPRLARRDWTAWNWLPVHQDSRRDMFRTLRNWSIPPHPAYQYQGMSPTEMLDKDEEGGPRVGCVFCIYASNQDLCHQAERAANRTLLRRLAKVEQTTGHTWWARRSAADLLEKCAKNVYQTGGV